jgi:hypothetical protein
MREFQFFESIIEKIIIMYKSRAVTRILFRGGGGFISLLVNEKGMKKGGIEAKNT